MTASNIRRQARTLLKNLTGKWELFLLPLILTYVNSGVQIYSAWSPNPATDTSFAYNFNPFPLLWQFIISLFTISASFTVLAIYRKHRDSTSFDDSLMAFSGQYLAKLFGIFIIRWLFLLIWSMMMTLPLTWWLFNLVIFGPEWTNVVTDSLLILSLLSFFIGGFMLINRTLAWSQVEFLLYDKLQANEETISLFGLFKESSQLMKGQKIPYLFLHLSFLGWYLLVILTLGLANIYVLPYTITAKSIFYNQLKINKEQSLTR